MVEFESICLRPAILERTDAGAELGHFPESCEPKLCDARNEECPIKMLLNIRKQLLTRGVIF